jgi:hypothetical protein
LLGFGHLALREFLSVRRRGTNDHRGRLQNHPMVDEQQPRRQKPECISRATILPMREIQLL